MTQAPILPQKTRDLLSAIDVQKRHPGLQLDKLSLVGDMKIQYSALEQVIGTNGDHQLHQLLQELHDRRRATLNQLAESLTMATCGPLTLHLSRSGALENAGIALHPLYGFVYLPGSGLKGLARAYAETAWAPAQSDQEGAWRQIEAVFGWSKGSERHKGDWRPQEIKPQEGASVGRIVFHDAWPLCWPKLIIDIANNHHPQYYAGDDDPGDWEDPTPIYFLALDEGEKFDFALSARQRTDDGLLNLACGWLKSALTIEGAGAKTAAGYGRFKPVEGEPVSIPRSPKIASTCHELRLASPAFLAGASQQKDDCDLRPATLRGLLRWWWRTLHAAHLDRKELKKLEAAVWGDTESGSPVRIAVERVGEEEPRQHPDKNQQKSFAQQHGLQRPPQKTIQGLFYASYGMAEKDRETDQVVRRWFRPDGSCWSVTLTVRRGWFGRKELSPALLLEQANAALWLLTYYGGAGSRSRKGFGSFDDLAVPSIRSIDDCKAAAQQLRTACDLQMPPRRSVASPALEKALIMEEVSTLWDDPWYALDQIGTALQSFAKPLKAEDRLPLGLPRRVGRGRDARDLRGRKGERHASPVFWSLAPRKDGKLLVRLIAFPAAHLPDEKTSKQTLQRLIDSARQQLSRQAQHINKQSGRRQNQTGHLDQRGHSPAPTSSRPAQSLPRTNDRIQAIILEETTKKGGRKAKHEVSGLSGHIQDSQNEPDGIEPGQQVELTVVSITEIKKEMVFKWAAPSTPKKTSGNKPRRGHRR